MANYLSPYSRCIGPQYDLLETVHSFLDLKEVARTLPAINQSHRFHYSQENCFMRHPTTEVRLYWDCINNFLKTIERYPQIVSLRTFANSSIRNPQPIEAKKGSGSITCLDVSDSTTIPWPTILSLVNTIEKIQNLKIYKNPLSEDRNSRSNPNPLSIPRPLNLPYLTCLGVENDCLEPEELQALLNSAPSLTSLKLIDLSFLPGVLTAIANLPFLTSLDVYDDGTNEELLDYGILKGCTSLTKFGTPCGIEPTALKAILSSAPNIRELDLNTGHDEHLQVIRECFPEQLQTISLLNSFSPISFVQLLQSCKNLRDITLEGGDGDEISNDFWEALSQYEGLRNLSIGVDGLTDRDLKGIAAIPKLESFTFRGHLEATTYGFSELKSSKTLRNLELYPSSGLEPEIHSPKNIANIAATIIHFCIGLQKLKVDGLDLSSEKGLHRLKHLLTPLVYLRRSFIEQSKSLSAHIERHLFENGIKVPILQKWEFHRASIIQAISQLPPVIQTSIEILLKSYDTAKEQISILNKEMDRLNHSEDADPQSITSSRIDKITSLDDMEIDEEAKPAAAASSIAQNSEPVPMEDVSKSQPASDSKKRKLGTQDETAPSDGEADLKKKKS